MTDDITTPNPKELDLVALFAGIEYPKDQVDIYLDPKIGYEAYRLQQDMSRYATLEMKDELIAAEAEYEELVKASEQYKYTIFLTGTSRELRNNVTDTVERDYPTETDLLGRSKPNRAADVAFENRLWQIHVEKISGPAGTMVAPTEESIAYFRANAPDSAHDAVAAKIVELSEGTSKGFESIVKSAGFLPQP